MNLPKILEVIARYILGRIVNCEGDTNHFVCEKWIELSIKAKDKEKRERFVKRSLFHEKSSTEKTIRLERRIKCSKKVYYFSDEDVER